MVGKAERGPVAIESIRKHQAAYLMAVGGAAYLVVEGHPRVARRRVRATSAWKRSTSSTSRTCPSRWRSMRSGTSVHNTAPAQWSEKIRTLGIPVRVA